MYHNTKEITKAFVKDGWSEDTTFQELTMDEAMAKGLTFAIDMIQNGRKVFKMNICGNLYSDTGKLLMYNIPVKS